MNKIALITGATSGIGKATAIQLSASGYDLILCGRRKEKLAELKEHLSATSKIETLIFDVRNKEEVFEKIGSLADEWKNIDVLVNNAGNAHGLATLNDGDIEDWDAMIDGNVKGLLYVSKAIIPLMIERQLGHIINLSSTAGKQTYENGVVYCASKKSVEVISEGMRLELTRHGIKITNVAPGLVATEFSEVRFKGDTDRAKKVYEGYSPLLAEDIADFITYAVNAPDRVTIGDVTIFPKAQASATLVHKK